MIKFGMPTLIECDSLDDCVSLCNALSLSFIELNMNLPQYQLDKIDVEAINFHREKHSLFFTIHLDENLNVSDFNPKIAKAYQDTVLESIQLAKQIGAPILNMHMARGVYFTLPQEKIYLLNQYHTLYQQSLLSFRQSCEEAIGDHAIQICIENSDGYLDFMQQGIETLLQSPAFGLTYDTGHDYCVHNQDFPFIQDHLQRLSHLHLHDATKSANHLPLGEGELDIAAMLALAKSQNCSVVLETKTIEGLKQSVAALAHIE